MSSLQHIARSRRALAMGIAALGVAVLPFLIPGVIAPKIAHAAPSVQTSFPVFADAGTTLYQEGPATAIISGPGGSLWMNEARSSVVKLTPSGTASPCLTSAFDGTAWGSSYGYGIAVGSDGNLWATLRQTYTRNSISPLTAGVIARVTPTCGVTYFPATTSASFPYEIVSGPSNELWFTEKDGNNIGSLTTGGTMKEFAIPTASSAPTGISVGPDGNVWFTESAADRIGRMTPTGTFAEFAVTAGAQPHDIVAGPDGNLWFTELGSNAIGKIATSGTAYTEYPTPTSNSAPVQITKGPDGALWFAEDNASQIGRVTTAGAISEYSVSGNPFGITTGPDGNMWYTDNGLYHENPQRAPRCAAQRP